MKLENKTVVITGAASGIGAAVADSFAQAGARIIVADIDEVNGKAKADALNKQQTDALFIPLDITQPESVKAFASAAESWHAIDILVNVAGWSRVEPFLENSYEFQQKIVDINYMGLVNLTHALLPAMVERQSGKIVNVSSDAGRSGSSGETVYAGAKGAVIAFTKSLAREITRYQINVNCVCPGPTETPLFSTVPEKHQAALIKAIPMRRLAQPSEIADAALFFACSRSDYVTGQVLSVSGGLTMVD